MNPKQLSYVITLAREGSFSRAAEALNISQPSLSQYIKKIEKQIGLELFVRTNVEVRLTDAGRVYIDAGRKILDIEHQMEGRLTDLKAHKTGSLIIGAAPYRAASMIPMIAATFQKIYPGMHLVVSEGTTAELAEGMGRGEYDFCITMLPLDENLFRYEKVLEEELVLAVPASLANMKAVKMENRRYPAIDITEVTGKDIVMLGDTQYMQIQLGKLVSKYHLELNTAAVVKSLQAQIEMVKAGVGMALMPSGISRFCSEDVVLYSFVQPLPKREVVAMWRKDRDLSETAKVLKKIIMDIPW